MQFLALWQCPIRAVSQTVASPDVVSMAGPVMAGLPL
jgi:hypothetical protein